MSNFIKAGRQESFSSMTSADSETARQREPEPRRRRGRFLCICWDAQICKRDPHRLKTSQLHSTSDALYTRTLLARLFGDLTTGGCHQEAPVVTRKHLARRVLV